MPAITDQFRQYLLLQRLTQVSVKNYVSDLKKFLSWYYSLLKRTEIKYRFLKEQELEPLALKSLDGPTLATYRSHLSEEKLPQGTIKRYLSSLRKFSLFLMNQGLKTENISLSLPEVKENLSQNSPEQYLERFRNSLEKEKLSQSTIKNYLSDANQFLRWYVNSGDLHKNHD